MPASNEQIKNRLLSGAELSKIIQHNVTDILGRDGMFTSRIAFGRVSYEVRVTLHLDNPSYPEHVSVTVSRPPSDQQAEANPALKAIELGMPLKNASEESMVIATEVTATISSPNAARIEHELPLITQALNANGYREDKEIKYTGDPIDPVKAGNVATLKDVSEEQAAKMGVASGRSRQKNTAAEAK